MSFSFGAPSNPQPQKAFSFGAATTQASNFSFGGASSLPTAAVQPSSAPASSSFSFGATSAPAAASSFGFGATNTVAPLSFGASTTASTAGFGQPQTSTSLSFGQPQPSTGLTFGQPQTSTAGVSFGLPQTSTTGLSFGQPQTSSSGLSFGPPQATSSLSFGQPPASTGGLSFGQPPASTAAGALGGGFGFGTPATSKPTLFGQPAASTAPAFGLGNQINTSIPPPSFGLGGSTAITASVGLGGTSAGLGGTLAASAATTSTTDSKLGSNQNVKEAAIPNELLESVEDFKKFVKEERSTSSDIAHVSPKMHDKISEEIEGMNRLVIGLMTGLSRNYALLDKIKLEAAQEILNAEIAQRTRDTPPGLQYENVAPYEYFSRLLANFEGQMLHYRRQIEETEQHLQSMASGQPFSPEDVAKALQKLHTAFIGLAGRYQVVHEAVLGQAESFVQWHRQRHGTTVEVFERNHKEDKGHYRSLHAKGPSPFNGQDLFASVKSALIAQGPNQIQQTPVLNTGGPPTFNLGASTPFGASSATPLGQNVGNPFQPQQQQQQPNATFGAFGSSTTSQGLFGTTMSPFGTSSVQTGGKRGKH